MTLLSDTARGDHSYPQPPNYKALGQHELRASDQVLLWRQQRHNCAKKVFATLIVSGLPSPQHAIYYCGVLYYWTAAGSRFWEHLFNTASKSHAITTVFVILVSAQLITIR